MVARFNPSGSMKKAKKSVNKLGMKLKKPEKGRKVKGSMALVNPKKEKANVSKDNGKTN